MAMVHKSGSVSQERVDRLGRWARDRGRVVADGVGLARMQRYVGMMTRPNSQVPDWSAGYTDLVLYVECRLEKIGRAHV